MGSANILAKSLSSPRAVFTLPFLVAAFAVLLWLGVPWIIVLLMALAAVGFFVGSTRAVDVSSGRYADLHSLPGYHGWYVAICAAGPAILLWVVLSLAQNPILNAVVAYDLDERMAAAGAIPEGVELEPQVVNFFLDEVHRGAAGEPMVTVTAERIGLLRDDIARAPFTALAQADAERFANMSFFGGAVRILLPLVLGVLLFVRSTRQLALRFRARNRVEQWVVYALVFAATVSILTTIGIVFSVLVESIRFFGLVPWTEFLFGTHWSPQTAIRADQVGSTGAFGAVPLFVGTLLISAVAMLVAGPIGLFSAIYLSEFASPRFRKWAKPLMEILAGVPTVVYGFFAALTVAPAVRNLGDMLGLQIASESALAAGMVMGIMIIPFVSSLSDDAISSVPRSLRDASLALGATRAETVIGVLLPAALPGIIAGFLLAISRAIGETMIVVMAAGLAANLTLNPLEAVTTVTVQIVTLLVGDQEFDTAKTLSAFALGFALFIVTLLLNVVALYVMQRFRERYE